MKEVDNILTREIEENKTPSVQYIIFDRDNVIYEFGEGVADVSKGTKIDGESTYNGFSVTKTFTALAILQLEEKGMLKIDESVKHYLPDFPYSEDITIRHLLSHSAGIPNPIPLSWIHLLNEQDVFNEAEVFKDIFRKLSKTKSDPNEKFGYSNLGYVILGQIISKASMLSYQNYVSKNIFDVLDIPASQLGFTMDTTRQVRGYQRRYGFTNLILGFLMDKSKFMGKPEGMWKPFENYYVNGASYGGLIGTPKSFVKYIQELLTPNSKLISDNYKTKLFTENLSNSGKGTGMCLSWFKGLLLGESYFAHAGGGGGYYCEIRIYPERDLGSVVMFNRTGIRDERFLDKLDKYFIESIKTSS